MQKKNQCPNYYHKSLYMDYSPSVLDFLELFIHNFYSKTSKNPLTNLLINIQILQDKSSSTDYQHLMHKQLYQYSGKIQFLIILQIHFTHSMKKEDPYEKKLREQIRRDKRKRQGLPEDEEAIKAQQQKHLTLHEKIEIMSEQIMVSMMGHKKKQGRLFFETIQTYLTNILAYQGEEKYTKINMENKAFKQRVLQIDGGLELFQLIGYEQEYGYLVLNKYDPGFLDEVLSIMSRSKQKI